MPSARYPVITPGAMRRKVTIETPGTHAGDGYGSAGGTEATAVTTFASVVYRSGQIQVIAGQATVVREAYFGLRYNPSVSITPGMVVVDGSDRWVIQDAQDSEGRHRQLLLRCLLVPGA